jgi:hypothetical protein
MMMMMMMLMMMMMMMMMTQDAQGWQSLLGACVHHPVVPCSGLRRGHDARLHLPQVQEANTASGKPDLILKQTLKYCFFLVYFTYIFHKFKGETLHLVSLRGANNLSPTRQMRVLFRIGE